MSKLHTVTQGECLASIAKNFGFASWNTIYNHPQNTDFKRSRDNPNIIFPGDQIFIPEMAGKTEYCETDRKHTFTVDGKKTFVRLLLQDEQGRSLSNVTYQLVVEGVVFEGQTNERGMLQEEIGDLDEDGQLTVFPDETSDDAFTCQVKLGHLDPINEISGIQARLNNLGFHAGPVDGVDGPLTKEAIKAFQEKLGLVVDGVAGPQTQAKLKEVYSC